MMNAFRKRPAWVDEEPFIQGILDDLIDAIDKNQRPTFRVTPKKSPELYNFDDDDPHYLWDLLKTLDNEYHIVTLKKQRNKTNQNIYDAALITLNPDKENQVRLWLNRPAFDPYTLMWNDHFPKVAHVFEDGGAALEIPLRCEGKTAKEVLNAFASLATTMSAQQTLRNLSAKCFWGDSKFLDNNIKLVRHLFPEASQTIQARPILMTVSLQDDIEDVLFIENLDSFLMVKRLTDKDPRFIKTALVYSAGFKGTSATVRKRGEVMFSMVSPGNSNALAMFEAWWLQDIELDIRCFFWGDMDYAGLSILKALRRSFPLTTAWEAGFKHMLNYHEAGLGHTIRDSKKMKQLDPGTTGCHFTDDMLLPAIRHSQRFLDQEVIAFHDFQ